MANVAIFKLGQTPQYLMSVDSGEYAVNINAGADNLVPVDPDVIINPDVSTMSGIPLKYWKRVGNLIAEMSASEKQAVDDAELLARKAGADNFGVGLVEIFTALIKVINVRLPANQKITKQELVAAVKAEIT